MSAIGPPEFLRPSHPGDLTRHLQRLIGGETLSTAEASAAFEAIMTGSAHHAEVGALLALLATRSPTVDELVGAAGVMRAHVDRVVATTPPERLLDTAGTGGAPKTFNVGTVAAIVAAAAGRTRGLAVAKHGNRSRTGRGSAEVLAALGVNIDSDRAAQARALDDVGVCFCFAIHHHPAAMHVMPVRRALGFPTIFNLLGPLTNPAGARRQLMVVYERRFVRPVADALARLGAVHAIVVHGGDGLDELSIEQRPSRPRPRRGSSASSRSTRGSAFAAPRRMNSPHAISTTR
ncbi:MAG: anthranilate phosphoribosyltransferase [Phycisphaerales bacterium]